MELSAPIYRLKREARVLSREEHIPLHEALDRIAVREGFSRWSLLVSQLSATTPVGTMLAQLSPGDLLLLGARPGHGKTQLSLQLTVEAMKTGRQGIFFTLEYNEIDMLNLFRSIGENPANFCDQFRFDDSDAISASYIIAQLSIVPSGTIVVVDYLQLLDQKRENPELMVQVQALKAFAMKQGFIVVFISQIDRSYEKSSESCPSIKDVRLPNPLDLNLFDKTCFLHNGEITFVTQS